MRTEAPLLDLRGLSVRYGATPVLADVDLSVARGEVVAIVGASGAGKTALLRALLGLSPPSSELRGDLWVRGEAIVLGREEDFARVRGRVLAWVPQDPLTSLPTHRRLQALMTETLRVGEPSATTQTCVQQSQSLFQSVGLEASLLTRYPHQLSGGQGQRVLLALALASAPAVVLADEPSSALDPQAAMAVLAQLQSTARREGRGVVLVSHDLHAIAPVADRVVVLAGGRVVEEGSAALVLRAPRHPYVQALVAARPPLLPPRPPRLPQAPLASACSVPERACAFALGCPVAQPICHTRPPLRRADGDHRWSCHLEAHTP